ncbi:hypothetical protein TSOC_009324 [Tetrabaena socialis]|uniref:Uncharacterized protein n=1 Tax=Tetrabaena socialis TaxID=47790 RepID=A0A2J7ZW49_9CHLO|nr:hypothetical protein TSOC_009324 [Tetrabaena socialis]|eukprot:PNH04493.1 hypothetical protein TSOC_009324 [Tetrabaena socialis]
MELIQFQSKAKKLSYGFPVYRVPLSFQVFHARRAARGGGALLGGRLLPRGLAASPSLRGRTRRRDGALQRPPSPRAARAGRLAAPPPVNHPQFTKQLDYKDGQGQERGQGQRGGRAGPQRSAGRDGRSSGRGGSYGNVLGRGSSEGSAYKEDSEEDEEEEEDDDDELLGLSEEEMERMVFASAAASAAQQGPQHGAGGAATADAGAAGQPQQQPQQPKQQRAPAAGPKRSMAEVLAACGLGAELQGLVLAAVDAGQVSSDPEVIAAQMQQLVRTASARTPYSGGGGGAAAADGQHPGDAGGGDAQGQDAVIRAGVAGVAGFLSCDPAAAAAALLNLPQYLLLAPAEAEERLRSLCHVLGADRGGAAEAARGNPVLLLVPGEALRRKLGALGNATGLSVAQAAGMVTPFMFPEMGGRGRP